MSAENRRAGPYRQIQAHCERLQLKQHDQPAATYGSARPAGAACSRRAKLENRGDRLHMAVAYPLRRGTSRAAAVQALLRNRQRRFFGRMVNQRRASEPLGPVSGGTVNDVEVDFGRRGDWVFVCFIGDGERGNPSHFTLGMVKAFTVR